MAQDHFKTSPDPKKGHGMTKKSAKNVKRNLEFANALSNRKTCNAVCWDVCGNLIHNLSSIAVASIADQGHTVQ